VNHVACPDCGYLFGSKEHDLGCAPYHDTRDPECRIRHPAEIEEPLVRCATCSPLDRRVA
jgi:hypothetical protein